MIDATQISNQKKLIEILKLMIDGKTEIDDYYSDLIYIYSDTNFRHSYSDITNFLIKEISNNRTEEDFDFIVECINAVYKKYSDDKDCKEEVLRSILKLSDHINLEIARIRFYKSNAILTNGLETELAAAREQLQLAADDLNFKTNVSQIQKTANEANKEAKKAAREYRNFNSQLVAILGIFAAIIVAFFGGLSYFSSVFNNINVISKYRLVFITALIGFVLFNVIGFLLFAISNMIEKPIFESDMKGKSSITKRIFLTTNIVLIAIIVVITLFWVISNYEIVPIILERIKAINIKK